jgi:hypothetical protein
LPADLSAVFAGGQDSEIEIPAGNSKRWQADAASAYEAEKPFLTRLLDLPATPGTFQPMVEKPPGKKTARKEGPST